MKVKIETSVALFCVLLMAGCSTTRGRPDYPYDDKRVSALTADRQLETLLCPKKETNRVVPAGFLPVGTRDASKSGSAHAEEQKKLCDGELDVDVRDAMIYETLGIIDLKYSLFRNELLTNRSGVSSSAKAITLLATTASALTDSAGVKKNYNALTQLITGGVEIYDKEFLHSQTLFALVAQMDANRAKVRNTITNQMTDPDVPYSGQQAYSDLLEYYQAGTILGALLGIQQDARSKKDETEEGTRKILEERRNVPPAIL